MSQETNHMKIMEQQKKQEMDTPLPVLPRLDRLDRLLKLLEEKHNLSGRHLCDGAAMKDNEQDDTRISLSAALEEVHHKGTLVERLTMLENRVLQLSLEMDSGNISRSSSSTNNQVSENMGHDISVSSTVTTLDENKVTTPEKKQGPAAVHEEAPMNADVTEKKGQEIIKRKRKKVNKKWFGLFLMGC